MKATVLILDPAHLATLATEFAEEYRTFGELGMSSYAAIIGKES